NWNAANQSGGGARLAMDAGAKVTFSFTGDQASWISFRDEYAGIARVSVDDQFVGEVDTYTTGSLAQTTMYTTTGLTWGTHTLTIEATGRMSSASGAAFIWVDAFDYTGATVSSSALNSSPTGTLKLQGATSLNSGGGNKLQVGYATVDIDPR